MPAPPSDLVDALRAGRVQRHLLFRMAHSQGTVLAWDGVGEFEFDGETYLGVAGFVQLEGVSNSGDLQNHEILATLNGVALENIGLLDTNVRGQPATITAVWLTEDGVALASRIVFVGTADVLRLKLDAESRALTVRLRGPQAEWRTPPRAYYTDADQQRRFPGDTGFKLVRSLENTTVSGWGIVPETTGGFCRCKHFSQFPDVFFDSVLGAPIGQEQNGLTLLAVFVGFGTYNLRDRAGNNFREEGTGATIRVIQTHPEQPIGLIDDPAPFNFVDTAGDVRTQTLARLIVDSGGRRVRRQGVIAGNGSATAETIVRNTVAAYGSAGPNALNGADQSRLIYCNRNGRDARATNSGFQLGSTGDLYVEDVTGAAPAWSGVTSGTLQVGGVNCVISTTGVVLSPGGRRIVRQGGTASEFLRIWT
jgi:hypothetical protein